MLGDRQSPFVMGEATMMLAHVQDRAVCPVPS